jgi:hypothetical protein
MRPRHLLLVAVAVSLLTPLAATAASRPAVLCKLLKDDAGDGASSVGGAVIKSDALDLLGGDVATGKKTLVGVLRLKSVNTASDPMADLSMYWYLNFVVNGKTYSFERYRHGGVTNTYENTFHGAATPVTVKSTANPPEVWFSIPRTAVPELKRPKTVIKGIAATSSVFVNNADAASTTSVYPDQAPSCLKPV